MGKPSLAEKCKCINLWLGRRVVIHKHCVPHIPGDKDPELTREFYLACNHSSRDVWNLSAQDSSVTNVDPLSLWLLKDERSFVRDEEENKTVGKTKTKKKTSQPYSSGPSDL